jgi:hypothetical protein
MFHDVRICAARPARRRPSDWSLALCPLEFVSGPLRCRGPRIAVESKM